MSTLGSSISIPPTSTTAIPRGALSPANDGRESFVLAVPKLAIKPPREMPPKLDPLLVGAGVFASTIFTGGIVAPPEELPEAELEPELEADEELLEVEDELEDELVLDEELEPEELEPELDEPDPLEALLLLDPPLDELLDPPLEEPLPVDDPLEEPPPDEEPLPEEELLAGALNPLPPPKVL